MKTLKAPLLRLPTSCARLLQFKNTSKLGVTYCYNSQKQAGANSESPNFKMTSATTTVMMDLRLSVSARHSVPQVQSMSVMAIVQIALCVPSVPVACCMGAIRLTMSTVVSVANLSASTLPEQKHSPLQMKQSWILMVCLLRTMPVSLSKKIELLCSRRCRRRKSVVRRYLGTKR